MRRDNCSVFGALRALLRPAQSHGARPRHAVDGHERRLSRGHRGRRHAGAHRHRPVRRDRPPWQWRVPSHERRNQAGISRRRQHGTRADCRVCCARRCRPATAGRRAADASRAKLQREFGVQVERRQRAAAATRHWWCWRSSPARCAARSPPASDPGRAAAAAAVDRRGPAHRGPGQRLSAGLPIVRAMPNRPALVGAGVTALYAGPDVDGAARALAEAGRAPRSGLPSGCARGRTRHRDGAFRQRTGLFFPAGRALGRRGHRTGLDRNTAELLAAQTLHGAGAWRAAASIAGRAARGGHLQGRHHGGGAAGARRRRLRSTGGGGGRRGHGAECRTRRAGARARMPTGRNEHSRKDRTWPH